MSQYFRARPTTYNGIRMRSRQEALWAAAFDRWGWKWDYEPECFGSVLGQYLPDFRIHESLWGALPVERGPQGTSTYVEVKSPAWFTEDGDEWDTAHRWAEIIRASEPDAILMFCIGDAAAGLAELYVMLPESHLPETAEPVKCTGCGHISLQMEALVVMCPHCHRQLDRSEDRTRLAPMFAWSIGGLVDGP